MLCILLKIKCSEKTRLDLATPLYYAGVAGIEPTSTVLETGMLPLHQTPEPLRRIELLSFDYETKIISHYTKEAKK